MTAVLRLRILLTMLAVLVLVLPPGAGRGTPDPATAASIAVREEGESYRIVITNTLSVPLTATVELALRNMRSSQGDRFTVVVGAGEERTVGTIEPVDRDRAWRYRYSWRWRVGDHRAPDQDDVVYRLPYPDGRSFLVLQGYGGAYSHRDDLHYSIDWKMPEGTPLVAARGGVVAFTEERFTEGGGEEFRNKVNYVSIVHDDGTVAEYLHLRPRGVAVAPGDRVEAGTLIGYSGNTGWSTTPHLHLRILRPVDGTAIEGLPTRFRTAEAGVTTLEEGESYTAVSGED